MYCQKCGNQFEGRFCPVCGCDNDSQQESTAFTSNPQPSGVCCPKCGSTNLQVISDVQGKGVKFWKVCCFNICGLCGAGKTWTTHYWVCGNCGNKFKV